MKGTKKQKIAIKKLIDDITKVVIYGGAAGGGKSYLGCFWLLSMCMAYPGTRYFIGRNELKRIRQSTLITWHKVCKSLEYNEYDINFQDNYISFPNGSQIDLLDVQRQPRDPLYERFGSTEYTGGWIEEAGEIDYGAFEVLNTRIGRHLNKELGLMPKMLVTCNPKKNWLYSEFYKPFKANQLPSYISFIQAFVQDNEHIDDNYIENLKNTKDKSKKERLLYGNWEYDDNPDALCSYDDILNIFTNVGEDGQGYITADIARFGSDKAVVGYWDGWILKDMITFETSKTTDIQEAIMSLRTKYNVPVSRCLADEDGVGGGVVDSLRIKGFVNGSTPMEVMTATGMKKPNYHNLQSQCCYGLAEVINEGRLAIKCDMSKRQEEEIIEELEQLKSYKSDNDGKIRILPKSEIKENIGRSPDYRDMFMMRYYFDLKPRRNYSRV
jgi:phage terminase large subunit